MSNGQLLLKLLALASATFSAHIVSSYATWEHGMIHLAQHSLRACLQPTQALLQASCLL